MLLFPTQLRFWIVPAIIASLSVLGYWFEPHASELLAYNRPDLSSFELWRLITGHLLHTNAAHLGLNLLGFGLLWALHGEYYSPTSITWFLFLSALLTSGCLFLFSPHIIWYVGLSGVLHGLFVWGACFDIARKEQTGWLLIAGVTIKIGYEQLVGDTQGIADLIGASVAIDAHLYGAISGLIIAGVSLALNTLKRKR